jgi:DNA-binding transcriptional MocR family regulator
LFINPGDVILAESPSYVGAIGVFRSYQAEMVHVATDQEGLVPESLRETIRTVTATGKSIKFLYLIPNFQNPSGVTLTWQRRIEILEIAKANGILVLEDNPYGLLYFDGAPPHAMRSLETDGVVYLGTFSKTFAPGLRLGWAVAPHAIREKLILANESAVLSPSAFTQYVISEYFEHSDWRGQIDTFRSVYRERKEALTSSLAESLPDLSWTNPSGGFYVWLTLPPQLDSKAMLPRAIKELVAYTPGTAFYANGDGRSNIRLSFCYPTPEAIKLGVRRLTKVINGETDLLDTFAGTGELSMINHSDRVTSPPPNID